jgi:hypothetical protein
MNFMPDDSFDTVAILFIHHKDRKIANKNEIINYKLLINVVHQSHLEISHNWLSSEASTAIWICYVFATWNCWICHVKNVLLGGWNLTTWVLGVIFACLLHPRFPLYFLAFTKSCNNLPIGMDPRFQEGFVCVGLVGLIWDGCQLLPSSYIAGQGRRFKFVPASSDGARPLTYFSLRKASMDALAWWLTHTSRSGHFLIASWITNADKKNAVWLIQRFGPACDVFIQPNVIIGCGNAQLLTTLIQPVLHCIVYQIKKNLVNKRAKTLNDSEVVILQATQEQV